MNKVAIIAVHPDDETLGAGGTLLKHKEAGDAVHWIIATDMTEALGYSCADIKERESLIKGVAKAYSFKGLHRLGYPAGELDTVSRGKLVAGLSSILDKIRPAVVYLPFRGDIHSDHRVVFEAAISATKSFRHPYLKRVLMMEILSETEYAVPVKEHTFSPTVFADITKHMAKKLSIMKMYASEIGKHPFPRSLKNIKALATYRGSQSGSRYAEGFMLVRDIWR